jgi:hypothetical protein
MLSSMLDGARAGLFNINTGKSSIIMKTVAI